MHTRQGSVMVKLTPILIFPPANRWTRLVFVASSLTRDIFWPVLNILGPPPSDSGEGGGSRLRRMRRGDEDEPGSEVPVEPGSEQALVEKARGGDRDAFRQLVVRHQKRVYAVVFGMVHHKEDALELTQETFIKAFSSLESYRGGSSFFTWLYRIAVNLTIDFRRKEWRVQKDEFDDSKEAGGSIGPVLPVSLNPHGALRQKEMGLRIQRALETLNPDQRMVVLLREVEGLSYQEIADSMGCSTGTVMSRLFYARKKLQEELQDLVEGQGGV